MASARLDLEVLNNSQQIIESYERKKAVADNTAFVLTILSYLAAIFLTIKTLGFSIFSVSICFSALYPAILVFFLTYNILKPDPEKEGVSAVCKANHNLFTQLGKSGIKVSSF